MNVMSRDGVRLEYADTEHGRESIVLLHGLGCNHEFLKHQAHYLSDAFRVISVDLPGHGASDALRQTYSMAAYADDVAWLCEELRLDEPVLIGHSMGGNVALACAANYPELARAIVLIDSVVFPSEAFLERTRLAMSAMEGPDYLDVFRSVVRSLCLPTDRYTDELIAAVHAPRDVIVSALESQIVDYDSAAVAAGCRVPLAYIGSAIALANLDAFARCAPQLVVGRTLGSGHFAPIEVSEQINAMLERFIDVSERRARPIGAKADGR